MGGGHRTQSAALGPAAIESHCAELVKTLSVKFTAFITNNLRRMQNVHL